MFNPWLTKYRSQISKNTLPLKLWPTLPRSRLQLALYSLLTTCSTILKLTSATLSYRLITRSPFVSQVGNAIFTLIASQLIGYGFAGMFRMFSSFD